MITLAIMLIVFSFHIQSAVNNRYKAEIQYDSIQTQTADENRRCCMPQAACEAMEWSQSQFTYSHYTKHICGESKFHTLNPLKDEEENKKK